MSSSRRRGDEDLARAIVDYLAESPRATDTVEGIAEWWLMRQQIRVNLVAVTRVLADLIDAGVLEVIDSGGERQYRLTRRPSAP